MIFGCCEICESVICGPGYCLLVPADAATVLLPVTLVHKQHKKNTKARCKKKTETDITRSCHCHTFSVLFIIPGGKVSRSISGKCSLVFTETASKSPNR